MSTPQGSTTPQVGWIGLGHIGTPMAQRVRAAGFDMRVWARRRDAAAPLVDAGAAWCDDGAGPRAPVRHRLHLRGWP
jgi:phosphoglycerate dehydrogenase-like enzyme